MPSIVTNDLVETCLRNLLINEGYVLNLKRVKGQNGVDIIAKKSTETIHIECIGYKEKGSARAKDFYESFFRVISRLNDGAKDCVIALSSKAEVGLPARAKQHRVAWLRISNTFPELAIWLVDTEKNYYRKTTWKEWALIE